MWVKGWGELQGHLVVISGPSGSGKTTLIRRALEGPSVRARLSVSATTRPPRPGEQDGIDYYFLGKDDFARDIREGRFLEHAHYNGHLYGTPAEPVYEALKAGECVILEIEVQGAMSVRKSAPTALFVFVDVPSFSELSQRLRARGTEDEEAIHNRLVQAREERDFAHCYDERLINGDIAKATQDLVKLLLQHGCGG